MNFPPLRYRPSGLRQAFAGQSMVEYMVVMAGAVIVLFIPYSITDNMSLADYMARSVRTFFRAYSFLVSVS